MACKVALKQKAEKGRIRQALSRLRHCASFSMFRSRSFRRKRSATPISASRGQAWKTSSAMQLISASDREAADLLASSSPESAPSSQANSPHADNDAYTSHYIISSLFPDRLSALARRRELAPADPEGGAHGGVAEDQMQVRASAESASARRLSLSSPSLRSARFSAARADFVQEVLEEGPRHLATKHAPPRSSHAFCFQGTPGHPDSPQTLQRSECPRRCCRIPGRVFKTHALLPQAPSRGRALLVERLGLASKEIGDVAAREHVLTSGWRCSRLVTATQCSVSERH